MAFNSKVKKKVGGEGECHKVFLKTGNLAWLCTLSWQLHCTCSYKVRWRSFILQPSGSKAYTWQLIFARLNNTVFKPSFDPAKQVLAFGVCSHVPRRGMIFQMGQSSMFLSIPACKPRLRYNIQKKFDYLQLRVYRLK